MDRRQRKTREAIFDAFTRLLAHKDFAQITVGQIIEQADVGRATFYAHFETKDYLLKEFCEELFCHIFDAASPEECDHHHIFDCDSTDAAFLHLFQHLQKNDRNILALLSSQNNELFFTYFRAGLAQLTESQLPLLASHRPKDIPEDFWREHIVATFIGTLKWWLRNGRKETPAEITAYFLAVV